MRSVRRINREMIWTPAAAAAAATRVLERIKIKWGGLAYFHNDIIPRR